MYSVRVQAEQKGKFAFHVELTTPTPPEPLTVAVSTEALPRPAEGGRSTSLRCWAHVFIEPLLRPHCTPTSSVFADADSTGCCS